MLNFIANVKPALVACSLMWDHCQNKEQLQNVPSALNSCLVSDAHMMQRSKSEICEMETGFPAFSGI